jgi:dTDP-4-dehydrorhamnose 3,5-epimerase
MVNANLTSGDLHVHSQKDSPGIEGVYYKKLKVNVDERGDLTELWSKPWAGNEPVANVIEHVYFNTTHENVCKGWHYHLNTFSQYTCVVGKMQVVLIDARQESLTYGQVDQFVIGSQNPSFIKIPPGVIKGWKSLKGDSVIVNLLTSADVADNYKIPIERLLPDIWESAND